MTKVDLNEMHAIQRKMVRMLKNKRKFGGAHTQTLNLKNCVPKHIRGEKVVGEAIKDVFSSNGGRSPTGRSLNSV